MGAPGLDRATGGAGVAGWQQSAHPGPSGVAIKGYVKGDGGDKGVIGAVVEVHNLQTGQLVQAFSISAGAGKGPLNLGSAWAPDLCLH